MFKNYQLNKLFQVNKFKLKKCKKMSSCKHELY